MSLKYSTFLNQFVDWTDDEILAGKKYLKWEELSLKWEQVDLLWEEVFILLEVDQIIRRGGGGQGREYEKNNPWNQLNQKIGKEKTKKVIKLYCKVNGIEFDETRDIEEQEKIKVSVNEFERFVKNGINIKIQPKEELESTITEIVSKKLNEKKYSKEETMILINSYLSRISDGLEDIPEEKLQEVRKILEHLAEKYIKENSLFGV